MISHSGYCVKGEKSIWIECYIDIKKTPVSCVFFRHMLYIVVFIDSCLFFCGQLCFQLLDIFLLLEKLCV